MASISAMALFCCVPYETSAAATMAMLCTPPLPHDTAAGWDAWKAIAECLVAWHQDLGTNMPTNTAQGSISQWPAYVHARA
jgi:hypothetical protein